MGSGWRQLGAGRGSWRLITAAAPGLRKEQSPKTNRGHSSPASTSLSRWPPLAGCCVTWADWGLPARKFFLTNRLPASPSVLGAGLGNPSTLISQPVIRREGRWGSGTRRGTQNRRGSGVPGGSVYPSGGTAVNLRLLPEAAKVLARARRASRFFPRVCAGNQPCNLDVLAGARPGTQTLGAARPRGESVSAAHTWAPQELTLEPVRDRLLPSSPPGRWAALPPNPRLWP